MKLPKFPKVFPLKRPPRRLNANAMARRTAPAMDDYDEEPQTKFSSAIVVVLILHIVAVGGIYAFNSIKAHRKLVEPTAAPATVGTAPGGGTSAPKPKVETPERSVPAPVLASISPITGASVYKVKAGDNLTKVAAQQGVSVADLEDANPGNKNLAILKPGQVLNLPKAKAASVPVKKVVEEAPKAAAPVVKKVEEAPKAAAPVVKKVEDAPKVAATAKPAPKTYTVAKGENPEAIAKKLGVSYQALLKLNGIEDPKKLQIGQSLKVPPPVKKD